MSDVGTADPWGCITGTLYNVASDSGVGAGPKGSLSNKLPISNLLCNRPPPAWQLQMTCFAEGSSGLSWGNWEACRHLVDSQGPASLDSCICRCGASSG